MEWLIYGANGYTGELIAREAVRRGMHPVLAGRTRSTIEPLARELALPFRIFPIEQPALKDIGAVLHCAGPFSRTSASMVDACLAAGAHYLDITGEIAVFESVFQRREDARRAGVALIPGVGFDVVPTDCLAAMLSDALPGAKELTLAFAAPGARISRGTYRTMIDGMSEGGAIRRDGRIVRVPVAWDVREIPFSIGLRTAMTVPWGDVSTAYHTTRIPSIRVYTATPPAQVKRLRRIAPLIPFLGRWPLRPLLQFLAKSRKGPDAGARERGRMHIWGEAVGIDGRCVSSTIDTPEGYAFTVASALHAIEELDSVRPGAWTPSRAFGKDFVRAISGVDVSPLRTSPAT
ncbi:MAG: saccharopine dehydrogenase NADP-binding domain-containing protein [Acidobacteriota bacterium]